MTSVSTPTTGSLRKQRSRKLGLRLGAAILTVATGFAIAFAITYTGAEAPSVVAPGGNAVNSADVGILNHAANHAARQGTVDGTSMAMNNLAASLAVQQGATNSADVGILNHAANYAAQNQRPVDSADVGILNKAGQTRYPAPTLE